MNSYVEDLGKQEEEYREYTKKLKDINKLSRQTLLEQSILDEDNVDFIENTINIIRFEFLIIFNHRNEVQQAGKDLNEQIEELGAVIAMFVNEDIPLKDGLPLDKLKEKWNSRFEEAVHKGGDDDDLLIDRLMDIKEEIKATRR